MRKLFSILAVALFALSAHATVVTKDITWTLTEGNTFNLNGWGTKGPEWGWTEGCAEYDQLVFEFDNPTGDILVKAQFTEGANASDIASSAILRVGDNSLAVNVTADVLHSVEVRNNSGTAQTITLNRMYLRGAVGPKKTETLWEEEGGRYFEDFEQTWGDEIVLETQFADVHAGDILEIEYTLGSAEYHQLAIQSSWDNPAYYPAFLGTLNTYKQYNIDKDANPSKVSFAIMSETDVEKLRTKGGLHINAKYLTITSVKLIKHELLWSGNQTIGNWDESIPVEASKLSELEVGDVLCFHINNYAAGGLIYLKYGDWKDFSPKKQYKFADAGSEEKTVEILVTTSMRNQLNGNNLIVQGAQYSINEIYVKKGTGPAVTVNKEIEVTSAGMATLVLPFAVPSLPDGVEAYTLTNSGDKDIIATEVYSLNADEPVLIKAPQDYYTFVSEEGASLDISSKTGLYRNGALVGTYYKINDVSAISTDADANYKYLLQNGSEGVGFYQVRDNSCYVDPYRAYLSCGYPGNTGGSAPARMRIVFRENTATGVENTESTKMDGSAKFLRNGQLYILRNGVEYNANGALVK